MIDELARKFANAVMDDEKIPLTTLEQNGLVPVSLEEAMAVQRAFVEASGKALAGWKLAIISDGRAVAAPMIDCYQIDANSIASFPGQGISALEVEICFTLAADIPAATAVPFSRADILRHIDKVHLGVEFLAYRLAEKNRVPFPLFLADRLANHSFVLGPEVDPAIVDIFAKGNDALPHLTVTEGQTALFDSTVKHPAIDPLAPLVAFANASLNTGGLLKRGQIMTTGSLCGAVPSSLGADTLVTLSPAGTLTLKPQK